MSASGLIALLPIIIIAAASVILIAVTAFYREHKVIVLLTLAGLASALFSICVFRPGPRIVTPLIIIDGYSLFYMGLIFSAAIAVTLLSYDHNKLREGSHNEYYILLLLAVLGSAVLAASNHFASFFLGLEILSVSLYSLIAYRRESPRGNEAGIKYLILAGVSSSFLLLGMALIYSEAGTMELQGIAEKSAEAGAGIVMTAGFALIAAGAGFKLAVAPFHMWTPDVYEGAPAPVSAFVASVSKGAVFALLFRYFTHSDIRSYATLFLIVTIISAASMSVGNILALFQSNIKRVLAYSSIAHIGYLSALFLAGGEAAAVAVGYYLTAYFITIIGAFGVVAVLAGKDGEMESVEDYRGLSERSPLLSGAFTLMLLSLAGMPVTAGFIGKFYLISAGAGSALWFLMLMLALNSAIGIFYYLRIVAVLYARPSEKDMLSPIPGLSLAGGFVIIALTFFLVWFGLYPPHLIRLIQMTISSLS